MKTETKWPADAALYEIPRDNDGKPIWYDFDDGAGDSEELWIVGGGGEESARDIHCVFGQHNPTPAERAETEALAFLYCSAPGLYAALEALVEDSFCKGERGGPCRGEHLCQHCAGVVALAKARGGQP
jgi:hypothetical protein